MRYVPRLDAAQIHEAQAQSHAFWGGEQSLTAREAALSVQLAALGPERFRMEGLIDGNGRLLASLKRYRFLLAVPGRREPLPTFGIGAVFTAPEARGRGLAAELLRHALAAARAGGDGAALLYSDIDPAFYASLGFTRVPSLRFAAPVSALPAPAAGALALRPALPADRERLLAWYEAAWPADWLRVVREPGTWDLMHAINGSPTTYVLSDAGEEVGYLSVELVAERSVLLMSEWNAPLERRAALAPRVWAAVRALAEAGGATTVVSWLRPDDRPAAFTATPRRGAITMVAGLRGSFDVGSVPPTRIHFGILDHI